MDFDWNCLLGKILVKLQVFLRILTANSIGDFTKQFFSSTNFDEILQ